MYPSRRGFLGMLGAASLRAAGTKPDLLLVNGNIHTMDAANPHADAIAIAGGRFLAVGTLSEISATPTAGVQRIDLGGRTVVPGFIDAHLHTASSGLLHLKQVNCDLRSIAAIQAAIRERAAKTPPGEWVQGFMYDDTKTAEGRPLTKADLDVAAPGHPVMITHRGGHTSYVNSHAYAIADVNDATPDPEGGKFERTGGKMNGRIEETARGLPAQDPQHGDARRAARRREADHEADRQERREQRERPRRLARRPGRLPGSARCRRAQRARLRVHPPTRRGADVERGRAHRPRRRIRAGGRGE